MNKKALLKSLRQIVEFDEKSIVEDSIAVDRIGFMKLRDCLINIGTVLIEDFDNSIFVVRIAAGLGNLNYATIAMQLKGNSIDCIGYAKEGLFKQHTVEMAINKIKTRIHEF